MNKNQKQQTDPLDPTAESRKQDHISLAFKSQVAHQDIDKRFFYEPMLSGHPKKSINLSVAFLGKKMVPIWISSMTGGTQKANIINHNLAKACGEFKLGMGLGSCRSLLHSDDHLEDFNVRHLVGDQPLYANLGIAQIESLLKEGKEKKVSNLIEKLQADGLIVHVNPMQEWLQPEGDRYYNAPIETLTKLRNTFSGKLIVKEVGTGYGPESIKALLDLGVDAIDFAANGGTNFSQIELERTDEAVKNIFNPLTLIGHSAEEMVDFYNKEASIKTKTQVIISGGVKTFLDGFYLINKCKNTAVYGQASAFLKHAMGDYSELQSFVESQIEGLKIATTFLKIKN